MSSSVPSSGPSGFSDHSVIGVNGRRLSIVSSIISRNTSIDSTETSVTTSTPTTSTTSPTTTTTTTTTMVERTSTYDVSFPYSAGAFENLDTNVYSSSAPATISFDHQPAIPPTTPSSKGPLEPRRTRKATPKRFAYSQHSPSSGIPTGMPFSEIARIPLDRHFQTVHGQSIQLTVDYAKIDYWSLDGKECPCRGLQSVNGECGHIPSLNGTYKRAPQVFKRPQEIRFVFVIPSDMNDSDEDVYVDARESWESPGKDGIPSAVELQEMGKRKSAKKKKAMETVVRGGMLQYNPIHHGDRLLLLPITMWRQWENIELGSEGLKQLNKASFADEYPENLLSCMSTLEELTVIGSSISPVGGGLDISSVYGPEPNGPLFRGSDVTPQLRKLKLSKTHSENNKFFGTWLPPPYTTSQFPVTTFKHLLHLDLCFLSIEELGKLIELTPMLQVLILTCVEPEKSEIVTSTSSPSSNQSNAQSRRRLKRIDVEHIHLKHFELRLFFNPRPLAQLPTKLQSFIQSIVGRPSNALTLTFGTPKLEYLTISGEFFNLRFRNGSDYEIAGGASLKVMLLTGGTDINITNVLEEIDHLEHLAIDFQSEDDEARFRNALANRPEVSLALQNRYFRLLRDVSDPDFRSLSQTSNSLLPVKLMESSSVDGRKSYLPLELHSERIDRVYCHPWYRSNL